MNQKIVSLKSNIFTNSKTQTIWLLTVNTSPVTVRQHCQKLAHLWVQPQEFNRMSN